MRVGYVYEHDAANPSVQSTRPFSLLCELKRRFEIVEMFPVKNISKNLFLHKKLWYKLKGQRHHLDRETLALKEYAWRIGKAVRRANVDLVFSPSQIIPTFLEVDVPIVYCTDAPFTALIDYYESFSNLSPAYVQQVFVQERESHRNASSIVYPSSWAVQEAIKLCSADPAKLIEQPFGANLPYEPEWQDVSRWIEQRSESQSVSLVLVSADWARKGGEFALAVKNNLVEKGIEATLRVIGSPATDSSKGVEFLGRINKWDDCGARKFKSALSGSDFIILPSKAEAYGMALWEGAAHGLPMIGRATGGISSIIRNGETGLLFSDSCSPKEVADWIIDTKFGSRYRKLSQQAYEDYLQRGNWHRFVDRVFER